MSEGSITSGFKNDLKIFYDYIQNQSDDIQKIYEIFDKSKEVNKNKYYKTLLSLCERIELQPEQSVLMALCDRIANLKEGPIIQVLKNHQKSNSEILVAKKLLLNFVSEFYSKKHFELVLRIKKEKLFNEFYQELFLGIHQVGLEMNNFFESWQDILIDGINKEIYSIYGDKAFEILSSSIDKEKIKGKMICSDRSYSIPKKLGEKYISLPYASAFDIEIKGIVKNIEKLLSKLSKLQDDIFNKQQAYINYFSALKNAFSEKDDKLLIQRWQEVDIAWMDIDTPFQIGHPLEYYEDRYRHSVAPEWDLRVSNPDKILNNRVRDSVKNMFSNLAQKISASKSLQDFVCSSLEKVKVYNGLPGLYYGADMNGLFSAQVVPNDEFVSKRFGKKIFAFGDKIIQISRNKPKMKLGYEVFEKDFLEKAREIAFKNEKLWHLVYDITTNGHEFGHILWIEENTQREMNIDGEFKNIEEFKATCGGLVAFFNTPYSEEEFDAVMSDTIRRAVGLMAWRGQEEVLPYYCEGLIHLYGCFESKVLSFDLDSPVKLKINESKYEDLKNWYIATYESLANHYIKKLPSYEWLRQYVIVDNKNYDSKNKHTHLFVEWYWDRYKQIGQEVL